MARIIITSPQAVGSVEITTAKENHQYYIYKSGAIKYFKGETKYYEYYVEIGTKEKSTIFKKIMVLEKNKYGVVKFPETGTGFRRYGTIEKGGNSTLPKEFVGEGDHYLLPQTAAALFGVTNDIAQKGWEVHFGDMSSSSGSDPWQPGASHHAGHGHLGTRKGKDVDFRYLGVNGKSFQGLNTAPNFDKEKNITFFEIAYKFGFRKNFCTGAEHILGKRVLGVRDIKSHKDHGHIGLTSENIEEISAKDENIIIQ